MDLSFLQNNPWIVLVVFWELAWKGLALWKAAQQKQRNWFIALLLLNTAGILPIVYLMFFKTTHKSFTVRKSSIAHPQWYE